MARLTLAVATELALRERPKDDDALRVAGRDGKRAFSTTTNQDGYARCECFLQDFERGPAADHEDMPIEGKRAVH